jgi:palmitoyltransferase
MSPAVDLPNHALALSNSENTVPVTPPAATKQDKVSQSTFHHQGTYTPGEAHIVDVPADPESVHIPEPAPHSSHENFHDTSSGASPQLFSRRPSTTPVLVSEYRYCHKDKIIKPPRTHHCRACGTVSETIYSRQCILTFCAVSAFSSMIIIVHVSNSYFLYSIANHIGTQGSGIASVLTITR